MAGQAQREPQPGLPAKIAHSAAGPQAWIKVPLAVAALITAFALAYRQPPTTI